ncbi:hypothetical protein RAY_243 [Erwinia phage vB_EamM_RAY]|uniref:Uncharacterized protein n=10 Tax=Agricanvirus TaxID=1984776 RepID=A0A173GEK4_9CAUD|nr:hypothetical protein Ea357_241 [Erwinia phage Ea35-70]YP_009605392.1 hypothetical protein FDH97_gp249 [Erwinia phage vB_EamM_Deimos-Minion]YP_009605709.1 hypothetical protein FDH98_gp275 [Erwinia phage vB_EamM_RAY]YP_009606031.1 hypothetical protein FDH99_gp278 [Erwinia phage vB_EamM_Simmy50]YP_009606352.1 hypothetical protein FDI00_gp246 [Erwinia phage vB_EamM_Special G]YP_009621985.1 hypothetical protein FDJ23_gp244 [Erwinia phage vB_EamM_Desertfox]AUG86032.1 hypothetical protein BOSOLAP
MMFKYTTKSTSEKVWLNTIIVVSRHGEEIVFNENNFFKSEEKDHKGTFDELNLYLLRCLSNEQRDRMFEFYKQISYILKTELSVTKVLLPKLQPLVKGIYDLVSLSDLNVFMYENKLTHIPNSVLDTIPSSKEYPTMTTYVKADYVKLVNLSVLLHLMAPIIADYVSKVSESTGKQFKEHAALPLLEYTNIMYSDEMVKLRNFVTANCSKKPVPLSATLEGMSEESFPDWMLASVIARKLCINHVRRGDENGHLVAAVFAYINYNIKLDGKFGGGVMPKKERRGLGEDEREKAVIDNWKMKEDVDKIDILACAVGFDDPVAAAKFIEPDIDPNMVIRCLNAIPQAWNFSMTRHQSILLQWVVGELLPHIGDTYVPPLTVEYYDYDVCVKLVGIAQAVLWHRGYPKLAVFAATYPSEVDAGGMPNAVMPLELKVMAELEAYYGNVRLGKRQDSSDGLVHKTINTMVTSLLEDDYQVVGPDELLALSGVVDFERRIVIPESLYYDIAGYIRFLATR